MYSSYDNNILLLEKFCDDFIKKFRDIENIRFVFDPDKYFNSEKKLYLSHFMIQYKCKIDTIELKTTSVYQWSHLNIFGIGPHRLFDKNNHIFSYDETRDYITETIPQAFKKDFFNSYFEIGYVEIKKLACKIKEYELLSNSLIINQGDEKRTTKV